MGTISIFEGVTLDGVMQAPGRADEDSLGGFVHGGWGDGYTDEVAMQAAGEEMAQSVAMLFGHKTYDDLLAHWTGVPAQRGRMDAMRYTLLLHYSEATEEELGAEAIARGMRAFASYAEALEKARVLISAEVLQPSVNTTTLRSIDGHLHIQDGPLADTKEQLAGTFVIDVPDLDAAIEWARQAPSLAWGAVEIRPGATHTVAGAWQPST